MSAADTRTFFLVNPEVRGRAHAAIGSAPDGYTVKIGPARRTLDQNALFHSACGDIAKAKPTWNDMAMDTEDWKALLVVSHARATMGDEGEPRIAPDLEGTGMVQLRESTAKMGKARSSSLIEYTIAWAVSHGVKLRDLPVDPRSIKLTGAG